MPISRVLLVLSHILQILVSFVNWEWTIYGIRHDYGFYL
nr:MAG TPA: hypothetical protein [Caudoviricetes sp.]